MPDIISVLRKDHEKVKGLFDQFESVKDAARRAAIIEQAIRELEVHSEIEKKLVYPLLEEHEEIFNEAMEEHHVVDLLISELKKMKPSQNGRIAAKFEVLAENVRHHIKEEESEMFPKLKKADADLDEIGDEAESMKMELSGHGSQGMAGIGAGQGNPSGSRNKAVRLEDDEEEEEEEEDEDEEDEEEDEEEEDEEDEVKGSAAGRAEASARPGRRDETRSHSPAARNSSSSSRGRRAPARSSSTSPSGGRSAGGSSPSGGGSRSQKKPSRSGGSSKPTTRRKSTTR